MPREKDKQAREQPRTDLPRTDLPPRKLPYDDDYFGSGEEEGVVREREASGEDEDEGPPGVA